MKHLSRRALSTKPSELPKQPVLRCDSKIILATTSNQSLVAGGCYDLTSFFFLSFSILSRIENI